MENADVGFGEFLRDWREIYEYFKSFLFEMMFVFVVINGCKIDY
jgi:hypothetical protein